MFKLRDYQQEAVDALFARQALMPGRHLLTAPTGAGKSIMLAEDIRRTLDNDRTARILVVTHVKELVEQDYSKTRMLLPQENIGIYSASLGRRDRHSRVLFASVQSIHKRLDQLGKFDKIIVDEAHLVNTKAGTMYHTVFNHWPDAIVNGYTATPFRLGSGLLTHGKNKLFQSVAYSIPVQTLIDRGYLVPHVLPETRLGVKPSLDGAKKSGKEYTISSLEVIYDVEEVTTKIIGDIETHAADRKAILIFATSITHAASVRNMLRMAGHEAEMVTGSTDSRERDRLINRFRRGQLRILVNVGVLTTGFDAPVCDCIVMIRATLSPGLWVQMLGRGARPSPETNKVDCLVLDYGANMQRLGGMTEEDRHYKIAGRKTEATAYDAEPVEGEPRTITCPSNQCLAEVVLPALECDVCGAALPPRPFRGTRDLATQRTVEAAKPKWHHVEEVWYEHRTSNAGDEYLVANYRCEGIRKPVAEWIAIEGHGWQLKNARRWWCARTDQDHKKEHDFPETAHIAAVIAPFILRPPVAVLVALKGRFYNVQRNGVKLNPKWVRNDAAVLNALETEHRKNDPSEPPGDGYWTDDIDDDEYVPF